MYSQDLGWANTLKLSVYNVSVYYIGLGLLSHQEVKIQWCGITSMYCKYINYKYI